MIQRVITFSLDNKFFALLMAVFIAFGGYYAVTHTPLDAIPDLSDVQVIIFTEYPGQAPRIVEDQVTYPITTKMLSVPFAKVVRGYCFFDFSFVYVIFEDGTDLYWARSRVLEYLSQLQGQLPRGVTPSLGPDATGVGWAFMYALTSKTHDLQQLRSIQDWYLKYELTGDRGRLRGRQHRRLREAVPGDRRSGEAARLRHPAQQGAAGDPALQQRGRRPGDGDVGDRVHPARQGLRHRPERAGEGGGRRAARRHADPDLATSARSSSDRTCAAASPTGTARARPSAASSSCAPAPTRST